MYEAVLARPVGPTTVARWAATAADYGYAGIVLANPPDRPAEYDSSTIRETYDIDVVDGVQLAPVDPATASGAVANQRASTTVLCLRGGDPNVDGFAARQASVDVLSGPVAASRDLDHVLVRTAAEHGVRLAVDLDPLLRDPGADRTEAIAGLRKLGELLDDAEAPYVVTGSPRSHLELRSPRELAAAASVAGFDRDGIERGLAEWGRLAERNRERRSSGFVEPGVRREVDGG